MISDNIPSVDNLLICNLCSELYDDPRLLPCSHTYCLRCITNNISINEKYFQCLFCDEIKIKENDINSLPSNQLINDIAQLNIEMKSPRICSNCDISIAEYICNICPQNEYCLKCYEDIHKPRVLQNHQKLSINKKTSQILSCQLHSDEKLKKWCQQCHVPVCSDCLLDQHKDHPYNQIDKAAKELEIKIKTDFEMIKSSLNNKITEANILLDKININYQLNKKTIIDSMNFLREIIDEHEKQILQDIENLQKQENQEIEKYKIKLENQLNNSNLQKQSFDLFILINNQIKLLNNKKQFIYYINQIDQILNKLQIPNQINYYIHGIDLLQNIKQQIIQFITVKQHQNIKIFTDEIFTIEQLIQQYQTSQEVYLDKQSLSDQQIHFIIDIIKNNTNMVTLTLSNNQIGPQGIEELVEVLQHNKILTKLDLSNNEISDRGVKSLANVLKINKTLTTLYLYDNGISDEGIQYLTNVLENNTTLNVLDLQSNRISCHGAQYLADALRKNQTLIALYLSNNQIGNQGAQYLADALQQNKGLTMLMICDNQIDHEAKRRGIEILKVNTRLVVHW